MVLKRGVLRYTNEGEGVRGVVPEYRPVAFLKMHEMVKFATPKFAIVSQKDPAKGRLESGTKVGYFEGKRPIHSRPGKGDDVLCWAWRGLVAGGKP